MENATASIQQGIDPEVNKTNLVFQYRISDTVQTFDQELTAETVVSVPNIRTIQWLKRAPSD